MALTPEKKRQLDEILAREGVVGIEKLRPSGEEEEKKPGLLKQLAQYAIKPAVAGIKGAEFIGGSLTDFLTGGKTGYYDRQLPEQLKGLTYSPEEIQKMGGTLPERFGKGFIGGTKTAAGLASYAAPFAAPITKAPSAVSTIAPQAGDVLSKLLGVGTAGGFQAGAREYAEEDTTLGKVAGQTALGAGTAVGAQLAGEALSPVGKFIKGKLGAVGEKLTKYNIVKKFGKPAKNLGGTKLIDQMDEVGIKTGSIEQISEGAEKLLKTSNDTIKPALANVDDSVVASNKSQIMDTLDEAILKTKSVELRGPLEKVQNKVIEDLKGIKTAEDFYKLKQEYGVASHWSIKKDISESEAKAYRYAYTQMNDLMDGWLKETGEESFKQMNRNSTISIKVLSYLDDIAQKEGSRAPIGLFDMLSFAGGWAAGGPIGGFKSYIAKKLLLSPMAFKLYGKTAGIAGKGVGKAADVAGMGLQSPVGQGAVTSLSQFMAGGER